jgi:UDP-GlcNAc:undecaprenyl-phosphate GlcNAc-1-phosphate transferase
MLLQESLWAVLWIITAFWISKLAIPLIIHYANKKQLFDDETDERKIHTGRVPSVGGVAIMLAFLVTFSASSFSEQFPAYGFLIASTIVLFAAGLKDDIFVISPSKKLLSQLVAISFIVFGSGIYFTNMGGVFGISDIPEWAGILLTFFTMIVVINAINLIDGIDTLAGGISVIGCIFFGFWFYLAGYYALAVMSATLAASVMGFLWHNYPPAKIFMGDTGSLLIGFYLSIFVVLFVNYAPVADPVVSWQHAAPVLAAAILIVPLYDTLRVFIVRLVNGYSPFLPDNDHVHHHLLRAKLTHGMSSLYLCVITLIIAGSMLFLSSYLSNTWLLVCLLSVSFLVFPTNSWKRSIISRFSGKTFIYDELKLIDEITSAEERIEKMDTDYKNEQRKIIHYIDTEKEKEELISGK